MHLVEAVAAVRHARVREKLDVGQRLLAFDALKVVVVERQAQGVHNLQTAQRVCVCVCVCARAVSERRGRVAAQRHGHGRARLTLPLIFCRQRAQWPEGSAARLVESSFRGADDDPAPVLWRWWCVYV